MEMKLIGDFNRDEIASMVSAVVQGKVREGIPYMANDKDDQWILDSGNDWFMSFRDDSPDIVRITYRYQCDQNPHEEALYEWLKERFGFVEI